VEIARVGPEPADPAKIASTWAYELVRAFVAVDNLLQEQYERDAWETPPRVAAQLEETILKRIDDMPLVFGPESMDGAAMLLGEAVDNLGSGERLDAWDALALHAPVGPRSHRSVVGDPEPVSPAVEAARAELLRRGIVVVREREEAGEPVVEVTCADPEWPESAIPELLPGFTHTYLGRMPREIYPTPCLSWRPKGEREIRLWARVHEDEHLDEVVVAEDERQVLVEVFVCTPTGGSDKREHAEPVRIELRDPIGDREVVDLLGHRILPRDGERGAIE
jgi:hypothetical protein